MGLDDTNVLDTSIITTITSIPTIYFLYKIQTLSINNFLLKLYFGAKLIDFIDATSCHAFQTNYFDSNRNKIHAIIQGILIHLLLMKYSKFYILFGTLLIICNFYLMKNIKDTRLDTIIIMNEIFTYFIISLSFIKYKKNYLLSAGIFQLFQLFYNFILYDRMKPIADKYSFQFNANGVLHIGHNVFYYYCYHILKTKL